MVVTVVDRGRATAAGYQKASGTDAAKDPRKHTESASGRVGPRAPACSPLDPVELIPGDTVGLGTLH